MTCHYNVVRYCQTQHLLMVGIDLDRIVIVCIMLAEVKDSHLWRENNRTCLRQLQVFGQTCRYKDSFINILCLKRWYNAKSSKSLVPENTHSLRIISTINISI